jgi:hypothetical protein
MKNKTTTQKDNHGFVSACILGTCPEVKKANGLVLIRNSQKPEVVVEFSEQEYEEFKTAIANKVF